MKKAQILLLIMIISLSLTGCATVLGGKVTEYQRTRPGPGEPKRAIRGTALIFDILLFTPGIIVDFATGAIYKPYKKSN